MQVNLTELLEELVDSGLHLQTDPELIEKHKCPTCKELPCACVINLAKCDFRLHKWEGSTHHDSWVRCKAHPAWESDSGVYLCDRHRQIVQRQSPSIEWRRL